MSRRGYQCIAGDTFDQIARLVYGSEAYACELLNANPVYAATLVFAGGEVLVLPDVDTNGRTKQQSSAPWRKE